MFVAIMALVWGILTGHATVYGSAVNDGVVVTVAPGQCVGMEFYGTPGMFGNVDGLTGGDCS